METIYELTWFGWIMSVWYTLVTHTFNKAFSFPKFSFKSEKERERERHPQQGPHVMIRPRCSQPQIMSLHTPSVFREATTH